MYDQKPTGANKFEQYYLWVALILSTFKLEQKTVSFLFSQRLTLEFQMGEKSCLLIGFRAIDFEIYYE